MFGFEESEKGLVATNVELEDGAKMSNFGKSSKTSSGLSNGTIKAALAILFIAQAAVIYKVFFTTVAG